MPPRALSAPTPQAAPGELLGIALHAGADDDVRLAAVRALDGHPLSLPWHDALRTSLSARAEAGATADLDAVYLDLHQTGAKVPATWLVQLSDRAEDLTHARVEALGRILDRAAVRDVPDCDLEQDSDTGNASRFVRLHGEAVRHCFPMRSWLVWDGSRWTPDDNGRALALAKDVARDLRQEAAGVADKTEREALWRRARRAEQAKGLRDLLTCAAPDLVVPVDALDADPWLLNCPGQTVNLRTGETYPPRQADYITKLTGAHFEILTARTLYWDRFLDRIFDGNDSLLRWIQKAAGYSLTGETSEQCVFILWGSGANGKTTFLEALRHVLGDYAAATRPETFMSRRGDEIPADLALLRGSRFVVATEGEDGQRLAESRIKQLAGGDTITARRLYQDFVSFAPTFKIWLGTNHKPEIRGTDLAIWRRIRLIPFTVTIPEAERDRTLPGKLQAEAAGILRWALDGLALWRKEGLGIPDEVRQATCSYRGEQDVLGGFLAERCILRADATAKAADLWRAFEEWSRTAGERPGTQRRFGQALGERGFEKSRGGTGAYLYHGVGLLATSGPGSEPSEPSRTFFPDFSLETPPKESSPKMVQTVQKVQTDPFEVSL